LREVFAKEVLALRSLQNYMKENESHEKEEGRRREEEEEEEEEEERGIERERRTLTLSFEQHNHP
jgi:Sec-independent protein translocase protein TatA